MLDSYAECIDVFRIGPESLARSRMLYAGAAMSNQTAVEYCIDLGPRQQQYPQPDSNRRSPA